MPDGQRILDQASKDGLLEIVQWSEPRPPTPQELRQKLQGCHGVLSMVTDKIDAELMAANPQLGVIVNHAVGLDNIDVAAASLAKIAVGNTPDVLTESTAELAAGLILSVARRLPQLHQEVVQGQWKTWAPNLYLGQELKNKKLGLFGMGRIAKRLAEIMHFGFGMQVLATSRAQPTQLPAHIQWVEAEHLLKSSDWIVVLADLNQSTRGYFNAQRFSSMKKGAYFINVARGGLHHEGDLYQALQTQHLAGAGLDVTNPEPMNANSPLLKLPQVVVTPHIGSATLEARNAMSKMAAEKLLQFCHNNALHLAINSTHLS